MNIFFVDSNSITCAQSLCNKHVIKQILESAQMLCTVHHIHPLGDLPDFLYKKAYPNHLCSVWVRTNQSNYKWLCDHALALCYEYTHRYDKIHKSQTIIEWCCSHIPDIPFGEFFQPPQAMPEIYQCEDSITAYRNYYTLYKRFTMDMQWKKGESPVWW